MLVQNLDNFSNAQYQNKTITLSLLQMLPYTS